MKKVILLFLVVGMCFLATALEDDNSIVKTGVHVSWDRNGENIAVLRITGENLDWSKTLVYNDSIKDNETGEIYGMPTTWDEDLEIIMVREFGNYSDILYTIEGCNNMANFSNEWIACRDQREQLIVQMMNDMVNKSIYESDVGNLTEQKDQCESDYSTDKASYEARVKELTDENDNLNGKIRNGWFVGILGICAAGYTFVKYRGWGKRKHIDEQERPMDISR